MGRFEKSRECGHRKRSSSEQVHLSVHNSPSPIEAIESMPDTESRRSDKPISDIACELIRASEKKKFYENIPRLIYISF